MLFLKEIRELRILTPLVYSSCCQSDLNDSESYLFIKNSTSFCVALPLWEILFFTSIGISAKV